MDIMTETEKNTETKKENRPWHRWFGNLFRVSLIPLGLQVETGYPVMKDPPEADVVIIRRNEPVWTEAQADRLPDGVRDTDAAHVILELKYSESVNRDALCQTGGYYKFCRTHNKLKDREIQVFLISSKTPRKSTLEEFGYELTEKAGVFARKGGIMDWLNMTPEETQAMRRRWLDRVCSELTPEEVLSRYRPEERLAGLGPEEVLSRYRPEERLTGLRPEEIEAYLKKIRGRKNTAP